MVRKQTVKYFYNDKKDSSVTTALLPSDTSGALIFVYIFKNYPIMDEQVKCNRKIEILRLTSVTAQ